MATALAVMGCDIVTEAIAIIRPHHARWLAARGGPS
jgi:hypothetical protein